MFGIFTHGLRGFGGLLKSAQKDVFCFIYCSIWVTIPNQIINEPAFVMCDMTMGLAQFTTKRGVCIET